MMLYQKATGLFLLLWLNTSIAATQAQITKFIEQSQQSSHAWSLLTDLTTNVGARRAGTAAEQRAIHWAQTQLETMGFDRIYRQPVNVPGWDRGHARAQVLTPAPQQLTITALGYSWGTPAGGIKAPVFRVASLNALKEMPYELVKDQIVFIDKKMKREKTSDVFKQDLKLRTQGATIAAQKGAAALLIRSIGTSNDRFAHTGMVFYQDKLPKIPAAALSSPDADQLTRLLSQHGKVTLSLDLGCRPLPATTSYNLIAEYDGTIKPKEYVQVGAHLDSWDEGTGALDNGAGIAIVTAATGMLVNSNQRSKRGIRLVYYAAEEVGLLGAQAFARANTLKDIYLVAESDFGAGPIYQLHTRFAELDSPLIQELLNALAPLDVTQGNNQTNGGPDVSVLVNKGVPALLLQQDGSDYFDYHHSANDTLDKVNPQHLKQNVAAWATMLWITTNSEHPLPRLD